MQAYGLAGTSVSRYQPIISIYSKRQAKIGQGATVDLGAGDREQLISLLIIGKGGIS